MHGEEQADACVIAAAFTADVIHQVSCGGRALSTGLRRVPLARKAGEDTLGRRRAQATA